MENFSKTSAILPYICLFIYVNLELVLYEYSEIYWR